MIYPDTRPPLFSLSSGPVECYPEVLRAMSRQLPYDYDPAYLAFYEGVADKLAIAMRTDTRPLILQADPVLGAEAAAATFISGKDTVLNLASGVYGKGFGDYAARHAGKLLELEVPYDEAIDPEDVAKMLSQHPEIALVSMVHHDTPSGTVNPAAEIGAVVRAAGKLFLVDATSSFGGMAIWPAAAQADIFITGAAKCLGAPPGLTLFHASDAAWARAEDNPAAPRNSILSLLDWREAADRNRPFPFTTYGAELHALDAALDIYLGEGPETVWARHDETARMMRAGVIGMGLSLWAARPSIASPTCTAVRLPEGVHDTALLAAVRRGSGLALADGRGPLKNKLIRIGHMGHTAHRAFAFMAIAALAGGMRNLGVDVHPGAGLDAAMAELD